ncbi:hypothetical protein I3842_03G273500 [Carya illinoinensis]|uniref:Uncharacterized protein n=1 Tax=Carya illinoinensis TaxID=32201 RepID=A0A922JYC5_CARIL|nr:hypothetical protein I3842_03G273500 [Carya illinoinensis]
MRLSIPSIYLPSFLLFFLLPTPTSATKKSYVVYLGAHSHCPEQSPIDFNRVTETHYEFLASFLGSHALAKESILYSYARHINGFAATFDDEVAASIAKHPKVISVFLNKGRKLHTTRSWDFLGLEHDGVIASNSSWKKARYGEDTIIGNLDTGVWPESKSFSDEGMGPIPSKWKGICQNETDAGFHCNSLLCKNGTLDPRKVKGKILVCLRGQNARVDKGEQALLAGALGMVLANSEINGNEILADAHVLPASHINFTDGVAIFTYCNSTKSPKAYITRATTVLGTNPAPFMAAFSSKGPSTVVPEILKLKHKITGGNQFSTLLTLRQHHSVVEQDTFFQTVLWIQGWSMTYPLMITSTSYVLWDSMKHKFQCSQITPISAPSSSVSPTSIILQSQSLNFQTPLL